MSVLPERELHAEPDIAAAYPAWAELLEPRKLLRVTTRGTLVFALVMLAVLHPLVTGRAGHAAATAVGRWAARILRAGGVRLRLEGDPVAAAASGALIVSNHRSYLDILALLSLCPVTFLCKKEVRVWPLVGTAAERMQVVFVDRRNAQSRADTLEQAAALVLSKVPLVAFPEGTTSRGPGMRPTFPGLFRAAAKHRFAVLPMVLEYADPNDAWVGDDTLLRHVLFWLAKPVTHISIRFGEPIEPRGSAEELQRDTELWMRRSLQDMSTLSPLAGTSRCGLPAIADAVVTELGIDRQERVATVATGSAVEK